MNDVRMTTFTHQRCIHYVDIAGRSFARVRLTRVGWGNNAIFELNASISRKQNCRTYEIRPKWL